MKRILILAFVVVFVPAIAFAQQNAGSSNPVSDSVKMMFAQHAKAIVAGAEEMPADKYSYHPTPDQMTFAHLIMHLAGSNYFLCSTIAGSKPPETEKLADTDPKDKLVTALKGSFDYCNDVMSKADDSKLGENLQIFRRQESRAGVMITLTDDLYDHYSQAAMYLRLNGLLPPTAQRERM